MAEIDDYIEVLFYLDLLEIEFPKEYVRRDEIVPAIRSGLEETLIGYDERIRENTHILAEIYFDNLLNSRVFQTREDKFAGTYYRFASSQAAANREAFLKVNEIYAQSQAIGSRFFPDVFAGYLGVAEIDESPVIGEIKVPASDRIINLKHNQIQEIEKPLDELVATLEADNGIPDRPGLKERLLGQIKAGRELVHVGNFRAYLVYVTLLSGLLTLVEKYKDHVIGAAAATLIELLVKHVFGA